MARWRKIFDVDIGRPDPVPIYLWTGPPTSFPSGTDYPGLPSAEDIYQAPNFTLFLSPATVPGNLPGGEQLEDDPDQDVWSVAEVGRGYDDISSLVIDAIPVALQRPLTWSVEIDDGIRGDEIDFRGSDMTLDDDALAVPYAMNVGYSFLKVADAMTGDESQYFRMYVVDDGVDYGALYAFRQPKWQSSILSGTGGQVFDPKDVDTINRHRAQTGRAPIDLTAGWTPAELADMARNIRKHGREYNTGALKRRLMRT